MVPPKPRQKAFLSKKPSYKAAQHGLYIIGVTAEKVTPTIKAINICSKLLMNYPSFQNKGNTLFFGDKLFKPSHVYPQCLRYINAAVNV